MSRYYVTVNEAGYLTARYTTSIHRNIPEGAVEISAQDFNASIASGATAWQLVEGGLVEAPPQALTGGGSPAIKTVFTSREFLRRFTRGEYQAARTHENLDVQFCLDDLIAAQFVDLNDPDVALGLSLLLSEGVITEQRLSELLQPEPVPA